MRRNQSGYSLAEMLAVVLVLSLAAAVTIPNLSASDPSKLDLAAQEIAHAMRYARSEAIRTGEPHGFRQQSSSKRIRVFSIDPNTTPWTELYDVRHPISKKIYDIDLDEHPFARVDGVSADRVYSAACSQAGIVHFDASGIPRCTNPETVLLEQYDVTLTLGSHTRVVSLDRLTGRVSIQ